MLVAFISPVKFSKIVFAVWNFVQSLKFYHKNNSRQSLLLKSFEIRIFYRILNSRKRENLLSVFHRNSPKYSNDQRGKIDWNWLKFYGERNTGLRAITAPSYKKPSKLSRLQNTQLNLLTVTFLAVLKWTEISLRWLIVDGCVKKAKDWRLPQNIRSKFRQRGKNPARGPYPKRLDRSSAYDKPLKFEDLGFLPAQMLEKK